MRQLKCHSGQTSQFNEKLRPKTPGAKGEEERHPDGLFFVVGIFVGLILAWIIL